MLQKLDEFENKLEMFSGMIHNYEAKCPDTDAVLSCSNGRPKAGRPPRWTVSNRRTKCSKSHYFHFRAWTLNEAIEKGTSD